MAQAFTVWLTGLPCSGKSTLAELVTAELTRAGHQVQLLDGDVIRREWRRELGFSRSDREENIRRVAFGCRLLNAHGVTTVAALVSPYRALRDEARASIPRFVEVHVRAPLETCIRRDVKGMYRKALAGEIPDFTGVSAPFEAPISPELVIDTDQESAAQCAARIMERLRELFDRDPGTP